MDCNVTVLIGYGKLCYLCFLMVKLLTKLKQKIQIAPPKPIAAITTSEVTAALSQQQSITCVGSMQVSF